MKSDGLLNTHRRLVAGQWTFFILIVFVLLLPLSLFYGLIGQIRSLLYRSGLLPSYRADLPVLSVGNLAVGGTGKTPVVDWLVREFAARGKRVAVLSRGYGGDFPGTAALVSDGRTVFMSAAASGDEPYLLARNNPETLVAVAPKRKDGLRLIEARGDVDLVILDDAFQHFSVRRDLDLVLLDEQAPLGNGWPLPAGNLREFAGALGRADFVVLTRAREPHPPARILGKPAYSSQHRLGDTVVSLDEERALLSDFTQMRVAAFSGIASPQGFFDALEARGIHPVKKLALPDHVVYNASVLQQLVSCAEDVDLLLTTEKDAVKLNAGQFSIPCYQVPLDLRVASGENLLDELFQRLWSKN
jgi:tetraacyldisaccharide 4'-kinase